MKSKEKELQNIYSEYKKAKASKDDTQYDEEQLQEQSVINPELTFKQVINLKEKDLNIQMMIALIKIEEEIQKDEKKINTKIKKIKADIGSFRYEYDDNGVATNADQMQKMAQKFEKARGDLSEVKKVLKECKEGLLDFEEKTGLTTNNVKDMIEKQEKQKREYEEQEKLRKAQIEEDKKRRLEEMARQKEIEEQEKSEPKEQKESENSETKKIIEKPVEDKEDVVIILPNKNKAIYIFEGKEGEVENIRQVVWGDKPKIFGKYKIREEEYVLTNNKTGEEKEYKSKLNPVIFEIFKTSPSKLEDYMNLKRTTSILYFFDENSKENKDIAKMMSRYQKQDSLITQKIGNIGVRDKISSRITYKLSRKPLLLEAGNVQEIQKEDAVEEIPIEQIPVMVPTTKSEEKANKRKQKIQKKKAKQEKKQQRINSKKAKKGKNTPEEEVKQEYDYEATRKKMEAFREKMKVSANANLEEKTTDKNVNQKTNEKEETDQEK